MESKAAELLAALKNVNLSIDAKIAHLTTVKSDIKQKNVPESAVSTLFESLRLALASQHSSLFSAGFSTLSHFLKRLFIQTQSHLVSQQGRVLYPILLDRLGDRKERTRAQAAQAFTDLWSAASGDVEHYVLEIALVGKNPRAREMSMIWLANMTKSHGLLFRAYVPSLVACLEDADSAVRDTAKMTVVELFQNAPARAKSDLTKQLSAHNVRKSIANAILTSIGLSSAEPEHSAPSRPASRADGLHQRPISVMSSRSHHPESPEDIEPPKQQRPVSRVGHERNIGPSQAAPDELPEEGYSPRSDPDSVEPLIVASSRDIDDMVRDMLLYFEGRESEENWVMRERNVVTLRRLTRGNAPQSFPTHYLNGIKTLLDGIFKVVNSLRTTLCLAGCLLIQDITRTCGPKVDSMVEIMMQNLIKLCGGMKKISTQNGNATVDTVIGNVTFTPRILQHVTSAAQDRNTQLRLYAAGWIKTILSRQARYKSVIEHAGGLDNIDKSIRKGLGDANPAVRETMRKTFWAFFQVWPGKANDIMSTLDAKSRNLLERDPSNPNTEETAAKTPTASSQKGFASSASAASSRSALKEAIAAQKRAHLSPGKSLPPRPGSAQSTFADVKPLELPSKSSSSTTGTTTTRTIPTGSHVSSLSSAPMRPAMKPRRPELGRPATADPYARRPGTEEPRSRGTTPKVDNSPRTVKAKSAATPSSKSGGGATRPRQKTDPAHMGSTMSKPKKLDISKSRLYDGASSAHSRNGSHDSAAPRPGRDSPAPIQLESPPGSVIQRSVPAVEEPLLPDPSDSITLPPPQQLSSVERSTPEPPQEEPTAELGDVSLPSPDMVANNARKQPAPVHIYEDPVVPTSAEPAATGPVPAAEPADTAAPDALFISADTLARDDQLRADGYDISPALEDGPAVATEVEAASLEIDVAAPSVEPTDAPVETEQGKVVLDERPANGLDTAAGADTTDLENHQPEVDEAPASPAGSVVHHAVTTGIEHESSSPARVPSESPPGNNENTTPVPSKFVNVSSENRSTPRQNVLEEIPNNEPAHRDNKPPPPRQVVGKRQSSSGSLPTAIPDVSSRRWKKFESDRRRSLSPRSKDPAKAREMLDKGEHRIRTKTMDILGYRKLQGLIEYHETVFETEAEYDEMLTALLDELESPPEEKRQSIGRPMDLKTQVLVTIRFMFRHNQQYFAAYHAKAVTALVSARKRYPSSSHIASGLEETAEDIIAVCDAGTVIDAILNQIEVEDHDEEGYRAITMGTNVISRLVRRVNSSSSSSSSNKDNHNQLEERLMERIGQFCGQHLTDRQPDVRRQVTDLSVALYRTMGDESRFWEVLGSPRENSRNLLTYYIHK